MFRPFRALMIFIRLGLKPEALALGSFAAKDKLRQSGIVHEQKDHMSYVRGGLR